jgi:hypothetical protein
MTDHALLITLLKLKDKAEKADGRLRLAAQAVLRAKLERSDKVAGLEARLDKALRAFVTASNALREFKKKHGMDG